MVSAEGLQQGPLSGERQQHHTRNCQQRHKEILRRLHGRLISADLNANRFQTRLVAAQVHGIVSRRLRASVETGLGAE